MGISEADLDILRDHEESMWREDTRFDRAHMHGLLAETALVTYVSHLIGEEVERSNRSSIWSRTSDGWKLRFHQGTPRAGYS